MKNNQKIGAEFEQKFCQYFFRQGFWAHFLVPRADGSQPFDILLIKDGKAIAIDCKTIEGKRFPLDRIETNQESAFCLMEHCGNTDNYFALKISEQEIILVPAQDLICRKQQNQKSVEITELKETYGIIHFE